MKKWLQVLAVLWIAFFVVGNADQAGAVTITERMDWVDADSYTPAPHHDPDRPWSWNVVRFDVTNNSAPLGVYGVMIGAKPGIYDWSGNATPAMLFGNPWGPIGYDNSSPQYYLPQKSTNSNGVVDWNTSLLPVQYNNLTSSYFVDFSDGGASLGGLTNFSLPASFAGYQYVYWFETAGPFIACSGDYCQNSVPISLNGTFSFYVTGGLGSPFLYLTENNYTAGGMTGTFADSGVTTVVPIPPTVILLGFGLLGLTGLGGRFRK